MNPIVKLQELPHILAGIGILISPRFVASHW